MRTRGRSMTDGGPTGSAGSIGSTGSVGSAGASDTEEISVAVSDPAQLAALREWLRQTPATVRITPGTPGAGELGAADLISVLAGSSGLVAAVRMLPDFVRSRRSNFRIETTIRGEKFVIDATNAHDVLPVIEKLLGE